MENCYQRLGDELSPMKLGVFEITIDGFQTKTPPFYTRHLIRVDYKVLSQLFQLIHLEFSYLNIARHFSGIGLCHENFILLFFIRFQRKST